MKNFKRITAICSALVLCLSLFTACGKDKPEENTTTSTTTTTSSTTPTEKPSTTTTTATTTTTTTTTTKPTTTTTTSTTKTKPTSTTTTTKKPKPTTTTTTTKKPKPTTTTTTTTTKSPTNYSKSEIVSVFNKSVNKVISSKAGYTKSRTTNLSSLKGAEALMKISVAKDAVYGFLGVGTKTYTNSKGSAKYLSKSELSVNDVKSAKCEKVSGDVYKITLTLADGKSTAPTVSDNSPLRHCGLFAGNGDNGDFDYKSANNIYTGIDNADGASVKSVSEATTGATITAQVNIKTGKLTSLTYKWNWTADLTKVKYSIVTVSGTGKADSTVTVKDFKW